MGNHYKELFMPAKIGKCVFKNKLSMAPMGPVGYADPFGGFNQRLQDYYVERAKGGVGLIITGICNVDMETEQMEPGLPCPTQTPLSFIHSTYPMNERIHAYGAKVFLQLTAGLGRSALPGFIKKLIAPSENENRFKPGMIHREMTIEEIKTLIQKFVISAVIAKKAGFDGVEIHAVHEGYLLDQFAIALFNRRTDEYGGSLENRLRVATEIVQGIKAACGEDYPVSLRYSLKSCMKDIRQGGLPGEEYAEAGRDIEEGIEAAKILVAAGYDALNVDAGTYDSWYWNHPPMYFEEGMYREFGKIMKDSGIDVPIILAGRMENPELAIKALKDSCDIIGLGRQLLTDSEYPNKVAAGKLDEIRPCLGCHEGCLGRISNAPMSCAVNPACGREKIYGLSPAVRTKHILIAGGGIAGMECARVLAFRGHKVTLCEKSDQLGGNLIPGGMPPFKKYDHQLVKWYEKQMELLDVTVKKGCEVTKEAVQQEGADEVIVATGSMPIQIPFPGDGSCLVANDILLGQKKAGKKVVIIGGGLVGCEVGLWLAMEGAEVTVVEMLDDILGGPHGLPHMNRYMLEDLLAFHKVKIYKNTKVTAVNKEEVTVENKDGSFGIAAETVISAIGYKEENRLYNALNEEDIILHNIGDSRKVHNIMYAIWDAYELAREI